MKTRILTIALLAAGATAFGQQVENDDMYFNSNDRARLKQGSTTVVYADAKKQKAKQLEAVEKGQVNPTDSYSARNVNPEFSARSQAEVAQEENQDYFVNNYRTKTSDELNNWNNNFNSWYDNPAYSNNYYSPGIYNWNSPYYGSYYNYGSPWSNPYYQSMLSTSFNYYWGNNNWNYGMGMGYSNYYCNPYNNSMWGSPSMSFSYGYGYGSPYYNSYYPSYGYGYGYGSGYGSGYQNVVVVENNKYNNYTMRNSRSADVTSETPANRVSRSEYNSTRMTDQSRNVSSTKPSSRPEYYDRNWRYNNTSNTNTTTTSGGFTRPSLDRNSNLNNSNSGSNSGRSSSYTPTYTPSSSRSFDGGGSRSSGGSSSGGSSSGGSHSSGGGSRSRGR
jgi:hypothetical protein